MVATERGDALSARERPDPSTRMGFAPTVRANLTAACVPAFVVAGPGCSGAGVVAAAGLVVVGVTGSGSVGARNGPPGCPLTARSFISISAKKLSDGLFW